MNLFEIFVKIGVVDNASSAMKNTQKNSETLKSKIASMSAAFEKAQKTVDSLSKEFSESVKNTGAASKETQELAKKIDAAEKEAEQAKRTLDRYNEELYETDRQSENAGRGISAFSEKLGVGIRTAATIGTAALTATAAAMTALTKASISGFSEYEQLAGGAAKIFDEINQTVILRDALSAYKDLGLSANQYLAVINDVGATFAATMGDAAGYETAKRGLKAISDYASGTGKSVDELSSKFTLITRSTSSYQSIADQFSGILPATSSDFLEQAQAAGLLSESYEQLTDVPIAEYQAAVAAMLESGVASLGLANNTAAEAASTISGSLAAFGASWKNLIAGLADDDADLEKLFNNLSESAFNVANNAIPRIGAVFGGLSNLIKQAVPAVTKMIPELFNSVGGSVLDAFMALLQNGLAELPALLDFFLTGVGPVAIDSIANALQMVIRSLPDLVGTIAAALPVLIPALINAVDGTILTIFDQIPLILEKIDLASILRTLISSAMKNLPILVEGFLELVSAIIPFVPEIINILLDSILRDFTSEWLVALMKLIPVVIRGLGQIVKSVIQAIPGALVAIVKIVFSYLYQMYYAFKSFVQNFDVFVDMFGEVGKNIVSALFDGIIGAWDWLVEKFNGLLPSLFDGKKGKTGSGFLSSLFGNNEDPDMSANGYGNEISNNFGSHYGDFNGMDFGISNPFAGTEYKNSPIVSGGTSIGSITINIDGAKYEDEEELAINIAQRIQNMTDRRSAVYA